MTELIVFKCENINHEIVDKFNERVAAFIEDKKVISTNVVTVGIYLYVYVFYKVKKIKYKG